ncbi:MAG: DNA-binding protein, partial [Lysobacteraceae bacterium]
MATKKAVKKAPAKKAAPKKAAKAAPAAPKAIKDTLNKTGLVAHIAEAAGVAAKDVRGVLAALEGAIVGSLNKKGAGQFVLPGLLKITSV